MFTDPKHINIDGVEVPIKYFIFFDFTKGRAIISKNFVGLKNTELSEDGNFWVKLPEKILSTMKKEFDEAIEPAKKKLISLHAVSAVKKK